MVEQFSAPINKEFFERFTNDFDIEFFLRQEMSGDLGFENSNTNIYEQFFNRLGVDLNTNICGVVYVLIILHNRAAKV